MQGIKEKLHGHHGHKHEHHHSHHHGHKHEKTADEVAAEMIVPGSVPVTGTYSRTEAEYQAAMGNAGVTEATRTGTATGITGTGAAPAKTEEVVGERPAAVGVAEVPVVVTEQERVVSSGVSDSAYESQHSTHRATEDVGERTTTPRATERATTPRATERTGGEVCGQQTFTQVEDRPVIRERVERIVEHRPVEKQYVVEARFVGERELGSAGGEVLDVKDRVVEEAEAGPTCPENTGAIMSEVVAGINNTTISDSGTTDRL